MLSCIVADLVYTKHGCKGCSSLNLTLEVYTYKVSFPSNYGDGLHEDGSDWGGHLYPRGIISWAYLDEQY